MEKLPSSTTLLILYVFFVFIITKTLNELQAKELNQIDIEIINGVIDTQKESITALNEFKKFQKNKNKSTNFIQKMIYSHESNIAEIKFFKTSEENKENLIDYEIPVEDLNSEIKFIYFLIDLIETNIEAYKDSVNAIENKKLRDVINVIIIIDSRKLEQLTKIGKKIKINN